MAYIKITDTWWTDGTNNEKIWEGEEIHKVGKYYVVNRGADERDTGCKGVGTRYRIWWNTVKNKWMTETKYFDVLVPTNKMRWSKYSWTEMETDCKPHIPRKQKKKIYGTAVITWGSERERPLTRLVQLHYRKDGCYYFKTPQVDRDREWNKSKWMINSSGTLSIKHKDWGWSHVPTEPKPYNGYSWAKVVSLDIY